MIRMLISLVIQLVANAIGLIVAASVLDKMEVSTTGVVVATVIFTVVYAIAQPFLTQMAISKASALRGATALAATLIGLVITNWLTDSDSLSISGAATWLEATVIVWIVSLLGVFILPLIFVKNRVQERHSR
jgi:putative membrane protein